MNGDNGKPPEEDPAAPQEEAPDAPQELQQVTVAQLAITPQGQLVFMMSNGIDRPVAFCVAAIDLISGVAAEKSNDTNDPVAAMLARVINQLSKMAAEHLKRAQVSKILKVPPGARLKQ